MPAVEPQEAADLQSALQEINGVSTETGEGRLPPGADQEITCDGSDVLDLIRESLVAAFQPPPSNILQHVFRPLNLLREII